MEIYLVGGAVRDQLLGKSIDEIQEKDWVVVGSTPEEMMALNFKPVGKDFPVFLHPETHEEYALARTERKQGKGYKGFVFYCDPDLTLEEDLARRDLTINAMAMDAHQHIIDPFGGRLDLEKGILRHVSPAFIEDPLRLLRVARFMSRFAPLGFSIAKETILLLKEIVASGELEDLTKERIWQECDRALSEAKPSLFFEVLYQLGALHVLFPEFIELFEKESKNQIKRPLEKLDLASGLKLEAEDLFALLLNELFLSYPPSLLSSGQEIKIKNIIQNFCKKWRVPKKYQELAKVLVLNFPIFNNLKIKAKDILYLLEQTDALRRSERFFKFLTLCELYLSKSEIEKGLEKKKYLMTSLERLKTLQIPKDILESKENLVSKIRDLRLEALEKCIRNS